MTLGSSGLSSPCMNIYMCPALIGTGVKGLNTFEQHTLFNIEPLFVIENKTVSPKSVPLSWRFSLDLSFTSVPASSVKHPLRVLEERHQLHKYQIRAAPFHIRTHNCHCYLILRSHVSHEQTMMKIRKHRPISPMRPQMMIVVVISLSVANGFPGAG